MDEHTTWKRIGHRLSLQNQADKSPSSTNALHRGKVLIICGNEDTSIVSSDLVADATKVLESNVEFRHFDAGHDVPISKSREVADAILDFWSP